MIVMDTNRDNAYTKCYIGSTCESLSQKMARRRIEYRNYLKGGKYFITSLVVFKKFGIDNCKIELLENCLCDTVEELRKREGHYKQSTGCVNNKLLEEPKCKTENKLINKSETTKHVSFTTVVLQSCDFRASFEPELSLSLSLPLSLSLSHSKKAPLSDPKPTTKKSKT